VVGVGLERPGLAWGARGGGGGGDVCQGGVGGWKFGVIELKGSMGAEEGGGASVGAGVERGGWEGGGGDREVEGGGKNRGQRVGGGGGVGEGGGWVRGGWF